jgi:hypothetical protein
VPDDSPAERGRHARQGESPAAGSGDPLYVIDLNNDVVLPTSATPINSFSQWNKSLAAQVHV